VINFVNIKAQDKLSEKAGTALTQGMWGFESGYNTEGDIQVSRVSNDTHAGYAVSKLGLVMNYPVDREGDEAAHDAIKIGDGIIFAKAADIVVEDDKLATNSTTPAWASLSFGDNLVVNNDGYLTVVGAADAPAGATPVAEFLKYENGIVFYRTV